MNSGLKVSFAANAGLLLVLLALPFLPYFSLHGRDGQEIRVWLKSTSLQIEFERSVAEFQVTFSELEERICPTSQGKAVNAVCQHAWTLQATGTICGLIGLVACVAVLIAVLDVSYLAWKRKLLSKHITVVHYLTGPLVMFLFLMHVLATDSVNWSEEGATARMEMGGLGLWLAVVLGIASTSAYIWLRISGYFIGLEPTEGLLDPHSTSQSHQISQLTAQLERYKAIAQEAELVTQRHEAKYTELQGDVEVRSRQLLDPKDVAKKITYQENVIRQQNEKLTDLQKQVQELTSGLPGEIQDALKTKDLEISALKAELQERISTIPNPPNTANTDESLISFNRKKQQLSASDLDERMKASVRTMSESVKRYSEVGEDEGKIKALQSALEEKNAQIAELERNIEGLTAALDSKDVEIEEWKRGMAMIQREIREKSISNEESLKNKEKEVEFLQGRATLHSGLISSLQSQVSELSYDSERSKVALKTEADTVADLNGKLKEKAEETFKAQQGQRQAEASLKIATEANQVLALKLRKAEEDMQSLRQEYQQLEHKHEQTLTEITQNSALQTASIQKILKEMHEKEVKELVGLYTQQALALERETARLNTELNNAEAGHRQEITTLQTNFQKNQKELNEIRQKFEQNENEKMYLESQIFEKTHENSELQKSLSAKNDEIKLLQTELSILQGKLSNTLQTLQSQQEFSLTSNPRPSLDSSKLTENSEIRAFFEQKLMKLRAELINERQERVLDTEIHERNVNELNAKIAEKERLEIIISKQKSEISDLQEQILNLEKEKSEINRKMKMQEVEFADVKMMKQELEQKEVQIKILENKVESGKNTEIRDLKDALMLKEQIIADLNLKIHQQTDETEKNLEDFRSRKNKEFVLLANELEVTKARLKERETELLRHREELDKTADSLSARYQQESESLKHIYEEHFQSDLRDIKSLYEGRISNLNQELDELRKENGDLAGANLKLSGAKQRLEKSQIQNQEEIDELTTRVQDLTVKLNTVTGQYHDQISINMSLENAVNSMRGSRGKAGEDLVSSLMTQNSSLTQELAEKNSALETAIGERNRLKSELDQVMDELETSKNECLALHKEVYESKKALFRHSLTLSSTISREDLGTVIANPIPESEFVLKSIYQPQTEESNAILKAIIGSKEEPPMTNINIWKTIEIIFKEKQKTDSTSRSLSRNTKGLDEVTVAYFSSKYKVKALAVRQMRALIGGLRELEGLSHAYGLLFSRMLGVAMSKPLPAPVTEFLVAAQETFSTLSDLPTASLMEYGPMSTLSSAQHTIRLLFPSYREPAERIASRLKVDNPDTIALLILKLFTAIEAAGHKITSWEHFFGIREDREIDYTEFMEKVNRSDAWITEKELNAIWTTIRNQDTDKVTLVESDILETPQRIRDMLKNKEFCISKCAFLTAIVEEFEFQIGQEYLRMSVRFGSMELRRTELIEKFRELESGYSPEKCEEMADETMSETATVGEVQVNLPAIIALRHSAKLPQFINRLS